MQRQQQQHGTERIEEPTQVIQACRRAAEEASDPRTFPPRAERKKKSCRQAASADQEASMTKSRVVQMRVENQEWSDVMAVTWKTQSKRAAGKDSNGKTSRKVQVAEGRNWTFFEWNRSNRPEISILASKPWCINKVLLSWIKSLKVGSVNVHLLSGQHCIQAFSLVHTYKELSETDRTKRAKLERQNCRTEEKKQLLISVVLKWPIRTLGSNENRPSTQRVFFFSNSLYIVSLQGRSYLHVADNNANRLAR